MSVGDSRLVGGWQRNAAPPCAARYPVRWQVAANGLYTGQAETAGEFTTWDSGTWRVREPGRLALSVASDEVVTYGYSLVGELLSFTDPQGCSFSYRRVG